MRKVIFHIDLDAFFASCEEATNPSLIGKPIVVCGRNSRSVVGCANYAARKLGVKAAMPYFKAIKLAPKAVFIPGHYELYEEMSYKFFNYIKRHFTNKCEEMSIDECWIDVTDILPRFKNDPIKLAQHIQNDVKQKLKLSLSIGISWNKFISKMATDLNKPFGITSVLTQDDLKKLIWPLKIEDMFFVGPPTAKRLKSIGINTIGDLANYNDLKRLEASLDRTWWETYQNALGNGNDFIDTSKNDPKSLSVSHTLLESTSDWNEISTAFEYMAKELASKLEMYDMAASCVGIIYKYQYYEHFTKNERQSKLIYKWEDLWNIATRLFEHIYDPDKPIRLVGISTSKLVKINDPNTIDQLLFPKRKTKLDKIVEQVNKKLGKDVLFIAKDKL